MILALHGLILASFDGFISRKARFCKEGVGLAGQVRSSKMLNSDSAHAARLICSRCQAAPELHIWGGTAPGKSAALQCLQVCLGVQARLTGRARSGKELINDNRCHSHGQGGAVEHGAPPILRLWLICPCLDLLTLTPLPTDCVAATAL